jgi:3-hydroxyisobutyrate dehydrogenase-like beta-hydroxyacid dehydrogenase
MRIAFLGTGLMGAGFVTRMLAQGHEVAVWNRTPGKVGDLASRGAREAATPALAVAGADAVVLVLHGPESVAEVLAGPDGVLAALAPGALVLDATTIGPTDARRFAA